MENEVKLTKIAKCAGCGAKVGAGTLSKLLEGFKSVEDDRLIVGYDRSDDASVYVINEETAIIQTTDFFPPIADDPYLYGQIAAANAISDVYAMGGEPHLALNIMCIPENIDKDTVREILRGGYDKAYEAGVIITGGHTINISEPVYGLSVTGFTHPNKVLTNANAKPGDMLILTKPLGIGILTTAIKAGMTEPEVEQRVYKQMCTLNKYARDVMVKYDVHSCTDVTGFALIGHAYEMAQGSGMDMILYPNIIPYHEEAYEYAKMGLIPAGAYRNREYVEDGIVVEKDIDRAMLDIMFDPQTSGGLLISIAEQDSAKCLVEMLENNILAAIVGKVVEPSDATRPQVIIKQLVN